MISKEQKIYPDQKQETENLRQVNVIVYSHIYILASLIVISDATKKITVIIVPRTMILVV
jgi:hypothetical protein